MLMKTCSWVRIHSAVSVLVVGEARVSGLLPGNILPYVEANHRVIPDREQRAGAGFSRGGGQSLFAGFTWMNARHYPAETLQFCFK
jgi:enterochelin esterase-like enzyme